MQVTFNPTGEVVNVGIGATTPQAGPIAGPYSGPYITTPSGYTPVQGTLTSGTSYLAALGEGGAYITFYGGDAMNLIVAKFKMDDAAAVTTGMATITAAIVATTAAITLDSDGTLGS